MIGKDKGDGKNHEKEKIHKRIHAAVDRSNYEYYPGETQTGFYDHDTPQRVAVYVRVSTDDIRQTTSYELQKKYYEDFVVRHPNWTLVRIYADDSDIFEPSQKVLAKPSVFLIWSNFLSFWANIHGGVAWDIFFLPVILREGAEKQLLY